MLQKRKMKKIKKGSQDYQKQHPTTTTTQQEKRVLGICQKFYVNIVQDGHWQHKKEKG